MSVDVEATSSSLIGEMLFLTDGQLATCFTMLHQMAPWISLNLHHAAWIENVRIYAGKRLVPIIPRIPMQVTSHKMDLHIEFTRHKYTRNPISSQTKWGATVSFIDII